MNTNKVILSVLSIAVKCIIFLGVLFVLIYGGGKAFSFGKAIFMDEPMTSEDRARKITVTIPQGATAKEIGEILERKNLIRDSLVFYVQSFCIEEGDEMKSGSYELSTAMTAEEMMETMASDKKGE